MKWLYFLSPFIFVAFWGAIIYLIRRAIRRYRYRRHVKELHKAEEWYDKKYNSADREE